MLDGYIVLTEEDITVDLPAPLTPKTQLGLIFVYDNIPTKTINGYALVPTPANSMDPVTGAPDSNLPIVDSLARFSQAIPQVLLNKFNAGTAAFERVNLQVDPGTLAQMNAEIISSYLQFRALFLAKIIKKFSHSGTKVLIDITDETGQTFQILPPTVT
jgi:hypothetical protein